MFTKVRTIRNAGRCRAFTLVEVMIVLAIIFVLLGLVLVASNTIRSTGKHTEAKAQIAMIANAIDQYASAWPRWMDGSTVVAEKGWPDFIPGRLFASPPFVVLSDFNDHITYDVNGGLFFHLGEDRDITGIGDVVTGNSALAYALTASSGKGPYFRSENEFMLKDMDNKNFLDDLSRIVPAQQLIQPHYPPFGSSNASKRLHILVDPWGTPYRYFWVYRDADAYNGLLPVETADTVDPDFETAEGFVLESAGPDRKFGNLWQDSSLISGFPDNIDDEDILEAEDNIIVKP